MALYFKDVPVEILAKYALDGLDGSGYEGTPVNRQFSLHDASRVKTEVEVRKAEGGEEIDSLVEYLKNLLVALHAGGDVPSIKDIPGGVAMNLSVLLPKDEIVYAEEPFEDPLENAASAISTTVSPESSMNRVYDISSTVPMEDEIELFVSENGGDAVKRPLHRPSEDVVHMRVESEIRVQDADLDDEARHSDLFQDIRDAAEGTAFAEPSDEQGRQDSVVDATLDSQAGAENVRTLAQIRKEMSDDAYLDTLLDSSEASLKDKILGKLRHVGSTSTSGREIEVHEDGIEEFLDGNDILSL